MTAEQIDSLLGYLPRFEQPDRTFITGPDYADDVVEFFKLAEEWRIADYDPVEAGEMLESEERIQQASLDQVRSMLTYCLRGEQFNTGHWDFVLRSGQLPALLRRLRELRRSLDS